MTTWHEHITMLRDLDMIEMKPTGRWGLTQAGEDFLDQLDIMRKLDDRPGAARGRQRPPQQPRPTPNQGADRGTMQARPARDARGA